MSEASRTRTPSWRACFAAAWLLGACSNSVGGEGAGAPTGTPPSGSPGASGAGALLGSGTNDGTLPGNGTTTPGGAGSDAIGTGTNPGMPSGAAGAGSVTPTTSTACAAGTPADAGANVLRRLSNLEYQLTVADLLRTDALPDITLLPTDVESHNFQTVAALQTVSAQHLRGYLGVAEREATALLADATRTGAVIGCELAAADCLASFVARFGRTAYRRTLEQTEIDALVTAATAAGTAPEEPFAFAIEALLGSANFLFRVEIGSTPEGLSTLTGEELAARLSFALWGRGPSTELLDQGASGALDTPEGLLNTANAMLADPKTKTYYEAFFEQWLDYRGMRPPEVTPPGWDDALVSDMAAETRSVIDDYAWGGGSLLDALTTNYTYASDALASFYDLPEPVDGRIEFPADHPRAGSGLLTHPAMIAAKTDGDLISIRGNWLRRTFLCQELSVPQELLDSLGDELVGLSPVEIVERRNSEDQCVGCHAVIDPIGVGFVPFDRLGKYDPEADIAEFGIAPGLPDVDPPGFASIGELAAKLTTLEALPACVADRAFLYANGREPEAADRCSVETTHTAFASASHRFDALVGALVTDPAFRLRRAPAPEAAGATP